MSQMRTLFGNYDKRVKVREYARLTLAVFLTIVALSGSPILAQNTPPNSGGSTVMSDKDKLLEELKKELEIANTRKGIAEANKAALKASLPDTAATALEGKTTATNLTIEGETLAYDAMGEIAEAIRSQLMSGEGNIKTLVIHNEALQNAILQYRTFQSQTEHLETAYNKAIEAASKHVTTKEKMTNIESLAAIGVPTTLVKSAIDLLALFRTDTEITGFAITIEEAALVSQVARKFNEKSPLVKILYPHLFLLDTNGGNPTELDKIIQKIDVLFNLRAKADLLISELGSSTDAQVKTKVEKLKSLNEQFDSYINSFLKYNEATGLNPLSVIARAAKLESLLSVDQSYVLYLKVLKAAGSNKIKRNLFFLGAKLRHSGAAVVNYILFGKDGSIKLSNTLYSHTGFTKFDRPNGVAKRRNF